MSPTLRTHTLPVITSHAVHNSTSSPATYAQRMTYNRVRRGAMTSSRVKIGPMSKAVVGERWLVVGFVGLVGCVKRSADAP
jgi:hypothetical protein